ncbi:MAG: FecR domain-containing protein, partial [Bacteroidetes bacterium]|nr:FecR domain-containing protein [Bacteroidota bacterium]
MLPNHIREFLQRFARNIHTEDEHRRFIDWLDNAPMNEGDEAADEYRLLVENAPPNDTVDTNLVAGIEQQLDRLPNGQARVIPLYKRKLFRVAAALLIILCASTLYLFNHRDFSRPAGTRVAAATPSVNDVLPGSDKAILVLGDGTEVKLEEAKNNTIVDKDGNKLTNANGTLSYAGYTAGAQGLVYHTVKIPRKGQYHLQLSDGTQVWLNAESSITFPATFAGNSRTVTITGEAYFDVAKNPASP